MFLVSDWLRLHDLSSSDVRSVLQNSHGLIGDSSWIEATGIQSEFPLLPSRDKAFHDFVVPAFLSSLGNALEIEKALEGICFQNATTDDSLPPHTIDRGKNTPPLIVMNWSGKPKGLLILAHEAAHALQYTLSAHEFIPPVARETCAFVGELLLLDHAYVHFPALFNALIVEWHNDNNRYLIADADALGVATENPTLGYHFRMNYPLARMASIEMFRFDQQRALSLFRKAGGAMLWIKRAANGSFGISRGRLSGGEGQGLVSV